MGDNFPTWTDIQNLVPPNGRRIDFQACLEAFPALEMAKVTPQSPIFHAEGDVWTHTKMVLEALVELPHYQVAARDTQVIVFLAALLHDVAKASTTVVDPETGNISQPGHSARGSIDARVMLWDAGAPFAVREEICRLVSQHQVPFFTFKASRRGLTPEFVVRELSWQMDLPRLAMLAEADMRGRIVQNPKEQQAVIDDIELFRVLATEEGCYGQPRHFADAHTAVSYFRGAGVHPDYPLHQERGSKVIVMSGLPASGKNTWVAERHPDLPVISFDDSRAALGLAHGKNEGAVAHHAVDGAKALLRKHAPFVWNATHITSLQRQKTLDLLYSYGAEVEIIYLEQPRRVLLDRNHLRDTSLSNKDLLAMLHKWEVPLPTEAHRVRYLAGDAEAGQRHQPCEDQMHLQGERSRQARYRAGA